MRHGFYVHLLLGGYDAQGPHVYFIDPAGGHMKDHWYSSGSGSLYVIGVLELLYSPNL
jgi:proteasome beta subunit